MILVILVGVHIDGVINMISTQLSDRKKGMLSEVVHIVLRMIHNVYPDITEINYEGVLLVIYKIDIYLQSCCCYK